MSPRRHYEDVRVEGHLIRDRIVSRIMDDIVELDGEFETLEFVVGRTNQDPSHALIRVIGHDVAHLDRLMTAVQFHGAVPVDPEDADYVPAPAGGVFPEGFCSTTNMDTFVRILGEWVRTLGPEMDLGIR